MKYLKTYKLFEFSDYSHWRDINDEDVRDVLDVIKTMSLNIIDKGDFTISHSKSNPMIRKSNDIYTDTRTIQFQVESEKDEAFSYKEISDEVRDIIEYLKSDNWHICYISYLDERMNRKQSSTSWDGSITNVDLFLSVLEDTRVISVYYSFKKEFRKVVKIQESVSEEEVDETLDVILDLCREVEDSGDIIMNHYKTMEEPLFGGPNYLLEVSFSPDDSDDPLEIHSFQITKEILDSIDSLQYYLDDIDWSMDLSVFVTDRSDPDRVPDPEYYNVIFKDNNLFYKHNGNPIDNDIDVLSIRFYPN